MLLRRVRNVIEEKNQTVKSFSKDIALKTLDTINMWINNCDSKASIILGSIGVIASIILSSDFAKVIKRIIETAFTDIGVWKIIYIIILLISAFVCATGLGYLVSCITPKIVLNRSMSEKMQKRFLRKSELKASGQNAVDSQESIMFYGKISRTKYDEYVENVKSNCDAFDSVMEDLIFQIHSASVICESKFKKLQKGIIWFSIGFLICCVQIIVGYYSF